MAGMNRFEGKDRRRERLRNHIAKDLRSPKYGQRIVPSKKHRDEDADFLYDAKENGYLNDE